MQAERLLSALTLLQARGRISTRELAARLHVSQRTAHRDMETLCHAGIPLIAFRGSHGGWELQEGWRAKVPGLNGTELEALLMAQPSTLGDPLLIAAAERAFNKLLAAMSAPMQTQASNIRARIHVDPTGWWPFSEDLSVLAQVQDAAARNVQLTFEYTKLGAATTILTVDPFGTVCKQAIWYLVARTPAGMRTYRISRMSNAIVLANPFDRPSSFDLAQYWQASAEHLKQQRQPYSATLALAPAAAATISRWLRVSAIPKPRGGHRISSTWLTLNVRFETSDQALFVVLGLGASVLVLAPPELRARTRAEVNAVSALLQ
jgi:predicted DNA-binding transcriptional regulator YafY